MTDGKTESKPTFFYVCMLLMVITGTLNTVFLKLQNSAYDLILNAKFAHPWFQTILMFIGEFYCAIMWIIIKNSVRAKEKEKELASPSENDNKPEPPPWVFLISCYCDLIGSTLLNFALLNMAGSVFQMLRGGIIIITCVFMIIFLKKYPKNYEWLGVGIVFLGVFLVGLASQIDNSASHKKQETNFFGIIMLIISLLFSGFQFIYQEKILIKYKTHPMQLVAWEGTWGLISFLILLPIFQFISCDSFSGKKDICSPDGQQHYLLENTIFAFKQMFDKLPVFFYSLGQTFSICGFNYFGIMLVKYSSAGTRAVMDNTRTVLVWIFFLLVPMANGSTLEHFLWLELVGFIVLLFGQIIYNGIIVVPFLGFDKYHKKKEVSEIGEINNNDAEKQLISTKSSSAKGEDA